MTIDLSQFVDKEVHITLRNGEEYLTTIKKEEARDITYSYYFVHPSGSSISYTECGIHDLNASLQRSSFDIIKIKLRNPEPMTIDLSQFVDKEVLITLRNGGQCKVHIKQEFASDGRNYYAEGEYLGNKFTFFGHYSRNGVNGPETDTGPFDIIKIKLRNPEPMTESLKCETLQGITRSLIPEMIPFVESHPKYAEVMYQLFDEFLTEKFGDMKPEVKGDIACMFMGSISFRGV